MQTEAVTRVASRAGAGRDGGSREEEAVEVKGETAMDLYTTLEPPACSIKARSSSKALGRPRGLGSELRE
jgi:hypothetical protein